jgi:hypothetical protein
MPHDITPASLAIDICDKIVFGEILAARPELCTLLRHAIFRAASGVIADQLAGGNAALSLSATLVPHKRRRQARFRDPTLPQ